MNQVCSLEKRDKHGEDQDEHNQVHDRRRGWTSRRWRGSKWTQSWPWLDAQKKKGWIRKNGEDQNEHD